MGTGNGLARGEGTAGPDSHDGAGYRPGSVAAGLRKIEPPAHRKELNLTLATGGVARLQVVCDQVGSSKGLPYISNSCLALSRGGDCSGRANFNCPSKSFWSASGWV